MHHLIELQETTKRDYLIPAPFLMEMKGPHLVSWVTLTFRVKGGECPVIPAGQEGVTFLGTGHHGD